MREISGGAIEVSQSVKAALATVNWTAALMLVGVGAFRTVPNVVLAWSIMHALWGCTFVGWALLVRERLAMERLAEIMADEAMLMEGRRLTPLVPRR